MALELPEGLLLLVDLHVPDLDRAVDRPGCDVLRFGGKEAAVDRGRLFLPRVVQQLEELILTLDGAVQGDLAVLAAAGDDLA